MELNLVDTVIVVDTKEFSDLKQENYLAINLMGTSPALKDGPIVLWESGGILDYLLEGHDSKYLLHPPHITLDSPKDAIETRAKYLHVKQYIIVTVYPFIASLTIHKLCSPESEHDSAYIDAATRKIDDLLIPTLVTLLGDGPFFLGQQMSAVDLLVAKPLKNLEQLGLLSQRSPLQSLFDRVSALPSFEQAYSSTTKYHNRTREMIQIPSRIALVS